MKYKPSVKQLTHDLMGTYNMRCMSTVNTYLHNEFVACLLNVETRIHSCEIHSAEFTALIESELQKLPRRNPLEDDFLQDHHLFGFFFNGLAGLESAVYGLAIMIGMSFPKEFPIKIPNQNPAPRTSADPEPWTLRDLTIKDVAARLRQTLPSAL